jgi:hypothetical protein
MRAAFPGAYSEDGGFVAFDMNAIASRLKFHRALETRSGVEFQVQSGEVWVSLPVRVGNVWSSLSWRVSHDEWDAIVADIAQARADQAAS